MSEIIFKTNKALKSFLDEKVEVYSRYEFTHEDPICIPHRFSDRRDIEISAFISAMLAWGQRKTIINKCTALMKLMDDAPYDFIINHKESDLRRLETFKHRTFNATDLLYFISFFNHHYSRYDSLETAFTNGMSKNDLTVEHGLVHFHNYFFSLEDYPERTRKHIPTPLRKSACKRINMFLRWMVRTDDTGFDFGLWTEIKTQQLISVCDVHVDRVARKLGLIQRKQTDWKTAIELTEKLRLFDAKDPVKYDFALFGLGVIEKY